MLTHLIRMKMDGVTAEKGNYIFVYYPNLLNDNETKALRHYRSTVKLDGDEDGPQKRMYLKTGRLSTD